MTSRPAGARRRQYWLLLHRWLGLWLAGVISLAGITGSLLVFYGPLDALLNPELQVDTPAGHPVNWSGILASLRQAEPDRTGAWQLEVPVAAGQPVTARYYAPVETRNELFAPLMVSLHPVTAEILTSRFWGRYLMTWIYDLHYTLLMGSSGKLVMAVTGLLFLCSLIAGFIIWWPTLRKPALALALRPPGGHAPGPVKRNYHLHKAAGVYGGLLLGVLAITGSVLAAPEWFTPLIKGLGAVSAPLPTPSPRSDGTGEDIRIESAISAAASVFPGARIRWIQTPDQADPGSTWSFRIEQPAEPGQRFPKTMVWIDRRDGHVLAVSDPLSASGGDVFLNWMHPLHSGEAFGLTGRIIVLISGLVCPLLALTGVLRWLQKRRAKARSLHRPKPQTLRSFEPVS